MTKKVILFNAPAGSGKDECAEYISDKYGATHLEFKGRLFDITQVIYGITDEDWKLHYSRDLKEKPWIKLDGLSPRQALIGVSEEVIKPIFGKRYFGEALASELEEGFNVVSDSGFPDELMPVIESVGKENILVVKIKRDGCSFVGDSRSYLNTDELGVREVWIDNNSTLEDLHKELDEIITIV